MRDAEPNETDAAAKSAERDLNGVRVIAHFGDVSREHEALRSSAGLLDLSARSRLCLVGADRQRFLNGQITNDLGRLKAGQGCYAALVNAKGRIETDLTAYVLADEIFMDFEPGLSSRISARLDRFVIADDVQVVDVAAHFGLLSVQGPAAARALNGIASEAQLPGSPFEILKFTCGDAGEIYVANQVRTGSTGFDVFVPVESISAVRDKLSEAVRAEGGIVCGWDALELARVETGIPRFGADMDDSNLAPEAGIETRAISYSKGCYVGQEVIARIRTYGQVAKALRRLRFDASAVPSRGDKLFKDDKEIGYVTTAIHSAAIGSMIGFGYVRRECNAPGTDLVVRSAGGDGRARIVGIPFEQNWT